MKVVVTLEEEIQLDPDEALGEIELIGDDGNSIQRGNAWLDVWLSAVLTGLESLTAGTKVQQVELMSETNPLVFRSFSSGARVTFRDETIEIREIAQLETELKAAVRSVIARLETHEGFEPDESWARLVRFANS